jgi:two-component system chemotaxis response regulator CheY
MRALVVDDSTAIRLYLRKILVPLGFEVLEARNGREALERLREQQVDLVLLDWNMPVMSGMEMLRLLRSNPETGSPCVMVITTETELQEVLRALDNGANEYVMKPFTPEIILDKLALLGFPVAQYEPYTRSYR